MTSRINAYRMYGTDWINDDDGSTDPHHASSRLVTAANRDREPYVFLDLREYYAPSEEPSHRLSDVRRSYHREEAYSRDSDHIRPSSAYRSSRSRSDYICRASREERYRTSQLEDDYNRRLALRFDGNGDVRAYDTWDRRMITEDGRSSSQYEMERRDLSMYRPRHGSKRVSFDEYERFDARSEDGDMVETEYDRENIGGYERRGEDRVAFDDGSPDSIADQGSYARSCRSSGFTEHLTESHRSYPARDRSSANNYEEDEDRRFPESDDGVDDEYRNFQGPNDESRSFQDSDDEDSNSDYDSTDAIDYYSESNRGSGDDVDGDDLVDDETSDEYDDDHYI